MPLERFPKKALLALANGKSQLGDLYLELDKSITLRILDVIAWDYTDVHETLTIVQNVRDFRSSDKG